MIEDETADRIIGTIRKLMKDFKMEPYNEDTGRGLVRHVLVKRGFVRSDQVDVVMVDRSSPILPRPKTNICESPAQGASRDHDNLEKRQ